MFKLSVIYVIVHGVFERNCAGLFCRFFIFVLPWKSNYQEDQGCDHITWFNPAILFVAVPRQALDFHRPLSLSFCDQ